MAIKIRISNNAIRHFYGDRNIVTWICKIKVLVRLQSIDDIPGLMTLCLEVSTFLLYIKMDGEDQSSVAKREACMEVTYAALVKLGMVRQTGVYVRGGECRWGRGQKVKGTAPCESLGTIGLIL